LSEAVPASLNGELVVEIEPVVVGEVIAMLGAVESLSVAAKLAVAVLPAASRAVTVMTFEPSTSRIPLTVQVVVPEAVPLPPRLLTHVTCVTPTLSLARPPRLSVEVPVVMAPLVVGDVMLTVGRVVSETVVVRVAVSVAVAVFPAASRAVTVTTFVPASSGIPAALQLAVPVAVPLPPRSLTHVTCVTPTLSDAVPPTVIVVAVVVTVPVVVGVVMAIVGRVVSVSVAVSVAVAVLPAASRAVTVMTFEPDSRRIPVALQLAVPVAVPLPPRLLTHVTCVTPTLSDAVPPTVSVVAVVVSAPVVVGEVIAIVGRVVSEVDVVPVPVSVLDTLSPLPAMVRLVVAVATVVGVNRMVTVWVAPAVLSANEPPETTLKGARAITVPETAVPAVFCTVNV
jgi:hypothetical protein